MNIKAFIQRHPVASYFALAYVIPWVGILVGIGPKFIRGEALGLTEAMFMLLVMLAGPSLAGITMTRIVDGRSGLRDLFSRMSLWRVGARWYAALLIFPVLILAVLLTLTALVSPVFAPSFTALGIVFGLLAGFFEEIGWMGYAFPKMQLKNSALATGILLGLLWGLWHLAAHYFGASRELGVHSWPNFLYMWIMAMTATRVLIVWVYCNTGSVLLTQLMHASSTGFLYILSPSPISPADTNLWYAVYAAALWVVVAIVAATYGKRLVRQPV
jgi:membrane protease YdiL (CAAX protease family)